MASDVTKREFEFPLDRDGQVEWIQRMRVEGKAWRDRWGFNWDRNVAVVRGDLWPDKSVKPQFLANIISPAVRRKAGLLVESKPGIDVKPRRTGLQGSADVLRNTITAIFDEQDAQSVWETMSYFLAAFGCGFVKVTWDEEADFSLGAVTIPPIDPRLMMIDPSITPAKDMWKASYVVEEGIVDYAWLMKRFPKTAVEVVPNYQVPLETNETHQVSWYTRLIDRYRKRTQQGDAAVPRTLLQQVWVKDWRTEKGTDSKLMYPGGRRIFITDDDVVLNPFGDSRDLQYGQANPHWDGLWPYVMLDNEPDLDHPFGHPEVDALRKMNEAFNSVGHNVVKTLIKNIAWVIADRGAIEPETLQQLKDLEEMVIEAMPGRRVERVPPTQPTATNMQFMQLIISLVEMYSGLSDGAMQGKGRTELRSGQQLEGLQQAAQVLIRAQARRLEGTMERVGTLMVSRIFQYMNDSRIMTYNDNGMIKTFDFQKQQLRDEMIKLANTEAEEKAAEKTNENLAAGMSVDKAVVQPKVTANDIEEKIRGAWRLYRFKVAPYSTLTSTKVARAQVLNELAQQISIPQSMVTKEAGFDNWQELQQQAIQELAAKQQAMQQAGVQPPQPPTKGGGQKKK